MKKMLLLTLAVSAGLLSTLAIAQSTATAPPQAMPHKGRAHTGMQQVDANGDGVISKDEAAKFPRFSEKFDQMDSNNDGKLSADERAAWRKTMMDQMRSQHAERRAECFAKADTDKNGQLSRAEYDNMGEVCGMRHEGKRRMRGVEAKPSSSASPSATKKP